VSGIGDVNGDSISDLIVGAPSGAQVAPDYTGRGYVFSGNGIVDLLITGGGSAISGFRSGRIVIISSGVTQHGAAAR